MVPIAGDGICQNANDSNCPLKFLDADVRQLSASDGTLILTPRNLKTTCQLYHQHHPQQQPIDECSRESSLASINRKQNPDHRNHWQKLRKRYPLHRSNTAVDVCSSCLGYMTGPAQRYPPLICDSRRLQLMGLNVLPPSTTDGHAKNSHLLNQDACITRVPSSVYYQQQVNERLSDQEKHRPVVHIPTNVSETTINNNDNNNNNNNDDVTLKSMSTASTFAMGSQILHPADYGGCRNNSYYNSQYSLSGSQCCQYCQMNYEHTMRSNSRWQSQNVVYPNGGHSTAAVDSSIGLTWRRLHMSRAKLKATATTSELLSGFAMVAMVELQINEPTNVPEWLFIMFSVCTTVLVAVHIFALMISTYLLPNIDAISKMQSDKLVEESPHERMKGFVEVAWAFSTVLGLFLFLVEVAILCWVKFWDFSIRAAMAATIIVIPVLIVFIVFVFHFYRSLMVYKCESSTTDINELEEIKKKLDGVSPV